MKVKITLNDQVFLMLIKIPEIKSYLYNASLYPVYKLSRLIH